MRLPSRVTMAALALGVALMASATARAEDWPTRPIRIVVGFGAGGGTDIAARIIAQPLSEILATPVVVENRVGAGGTTAANAVATAPKDGYTALMMSKVWDEHSDLLVPSNNLLRRTMALLARVARARGY